MTSKSSTSLFGGPPRAPESPIHAARDGPCRVDPGSDRRDHACGRARYVHEHRMKRPCAWPAASPSTASATAAFCAKGPFEHIWIQPAAGDAGGALGAATVHLASTPRQAANAARRWRLQRARFSGRRTPTKQIRLSRRSRGRLPALSTRTSSCERSRRPIAPRNVGWVTWTAAWSSVREPWEAAASSGDARSANMQSVMNLKIKFRESFRPFAPSVLREHVQDYFDMRAEEDSPYMLLVAPVRGDKRVAFADERSARARQAQTASLRGPGDHARRLLGPRADRRRRAPPALPPDPENVRAKRRAARS